MDWIKQKNRSYLDLSFDKEMTEEEVFAYGKEHNFWGYHPAGYGVELKPLSDNMKSWRWWRWNTCD